MDRVRRRRAQLQADDQPIQAVWIERAIIGFLIAAIFASYAGLTMFYLLLGTLWAASNVLGSEAATPGKPPVRRALRSR
jgi:hypothetical protein